jgi:RNA pol II accessory factor, Cdc73 family, C-terminal
MMIEDTATIQQSLLEWIHSVSDLSKSLSEVIVSNDGSTITLTNNVVLNARAKITIPTANAVVPNTDHADDQQQHPTAAAYCEYTVGAIFLQIRNPKQSLIVYRNDCKKYGIVDPVKAIDKSTIVNYFLPVSFLSAMDEAAVQQSSITASEENTATEPSTKIAAAPSTTNQVKSERSSSSKHHRDKEKHKHGKSRSSSSGAKSHRSSSSKRDAVAAEPPKKKKKPDLVTNEQLFEHLNEVVDKRSATATQKENDSSLAEAISKALSAQGFEIVDNEQLKPYQERTAYIFSNEIPVGNSASILRANNPRKNLSRVLELYTETVNPSNAALMTGNKLGKGGKPISSSKASSIGKQNASTTFKQYLVGKKPIIVVPKGMTAPITLVNAHEFLCYGRYVQRDAMVKLLSSGGQQKNPPTTFTRTVATVGSASSSSSHVSTTGLLEYEIIDNPRKLGPNPREWERIVAVIVLGQSWQFKDWLVSPPYHTPASLFDRVYGFFIAMEGDKIPSEVATWAVHKSQFNRDKRGLDSVSHASFWNGLDEWMRVYKAELLPQSG